MPRRKFLLFLVPHLAQKVITYLVNGQLERRIKIKEQIISNDNIRLKLCFAATVTLICEYMSNFQVNFMNHHIGRTKTPDYVSL